MVGVVSKERSFEAKKALSLGMLSSMTGTTTRTAVILSRSGGTRDGRARLSMGTLYREI